VVEETEKKKEDKKEKKCLCQEYDLIWGAKVSCEFRKKVVEICKDLWPNDYKNMANELMACMYIETAGKFTPNEGYPYWRRYAAELCVLAYLCQRLIPPTGAEMQRKQSVQGCLYLLYSTCPTLAQIWRRALCVSVSVPTLCTRMSMLLLFNPSPPPMSTTSHYCIHKLKIHHQKKTTIFFFLYLGSINTISKP
jgi:hypothetical protein